MQVPILSGIYADTTSDYRTSYPVNLVPVPKDTGISKGYLRTADGIAHFADTNGLDRGGIVWGGVLYRVCGSKFVSVSASGHVTELGDVGSGGRCSFDYSFDRLAISSNRGFYYFNGLTLTKVTDGDLGDVIDHVWIDGYHVTTDGQFIVVTELNDPTAVNPLKYGSSEFDPDSILGLLKVRNELVVLNRHSIEVFDNVGGDIFPFQRIDGAVIQKGIVGTHAKCTFAQTFAFVGSGRNEPISVYLGASGGAQKIATREIESIISQYTESQLSTMVVEAREHEAHQCLYIHLLNETLVYDLAGSSAAGQPVWFILKSGGAANQQYRAINFVYAYNKWIVGDKTTNKLGYMTDSTFSQYDQPTGWRFDTALIYNEGMGAIINSIELVGTVGRAATGQQPSVFCSYTKDGLTWSQERSRSAGLRGDYAHRMTWHRFGVRFGHWLGLRFRGVGSTTLAIPRLEIQVEPLNA